MKNLAFILIVCFLFQIAYTQEKYVKIEKGNVYWEKSVLQKDFLKIDKKGLWGAEKAKVSNAAFQKAALQESPAMSIVNGIAFLDEEDPENAMDFLYNELIPNNQIEWIKGPFEQFVDGRIKKDGKDYIVIKCIAWGEYKRKNNAVNHFPANNFLKSKIMENKKNRGSSSNSNVVTLANCMTSSDFARIIQEMKVAEIANRDVIAKNNLIKIECISSTQSMELISLMDEIDRDDFINSICKYIRDIADFLPSVELCAESDRPIVKTTIENEIAKRKQ